MEPQFSWDSQLQENSGSFVNLFPNDNQSSDFESHSFSWTTADRGTWNVSGSCSSKRLKLEDRLQRINDKPNDGTFQSFYLTSCFQTTGDQTKDTNGVSYLSQQYVSCGSQQPSTNGPTATREGPKTKSTDRFYASTAPPAADEVYPQPPQIGCYSSSEGTGFLEGIFNATTPEGALVSTAYESHSQYGFDPVTGHFVAPVSFFPHPNQGELLTPHPIASADPQSVGAGLNVKHHHQPQLHEQPRTLEETASSTPF
uniref:Homeobox domain-containing protein n=1 Tax=Mesocestoides corti TaxID=53468 RepID=A0A5K3F026_MESCO